MQVKEKLGVLRVRAGGRGWGGGAGLSRALVVPGYGRAVYTVPLAAAALPSAFTTQHLVPAHGYASDPLRIPRPPPGPPAAVCAALLRLPRHTSLSLRNHVMF